MLEHPSTNFMSKFIGSFSTVRAYTHTSSHYTYTQIGTVCKISATCRYMKFLLGKLVSVLSFFKVLHIFFCLFFFVSCSTNNLINNPIEISLFHPFSKILESPRVFRLILYENRADKWIQVSMMV